jgi:hypothetical protein
MRFITVGALEYKVYRKRKYKCFWLPRKMNSMSCIACINVDPFRRRNAHMGAEVEGAIEAAFGSLCQEGYRTLFKHVAACG